MKLERILKESFNLNSLEATDDKQLMSFEEWDSLSHMLFISKLEETYEIELSGNEIADMRTIGDIKMILITKGKEI
jgi:acyl carrier protein